MPHHFASPPGIARDVATGGLCVAVPTVTQG